MRINKLTYTIILTFFQILVLPAYGITAKFTYIKSNNCAPTVVTFSNNSTTGTGITYTWNFGLGADVTASDNSSKQQIYTKPGKYKVTLMVSNGSVTDTTSAVIVISLGPVAGFTADKVSGCPPLLVTFTSNSIAGESELVSSSWDFRNGEYMNGSSVQYMYTGSGLYDVVLKVTDKNGCSDFSEYDKLISITGKPNISFAASDTFACAPPLNVTFSNYSTGSTDLKYKWDFGNGKTSTELSTSSVYSSNGSYSVKLKATDQVGCSDSLTKTSYINIGYTKGTLSVYDSKNKLIDQSYICDGTYRFVYSNSKLPNYKWVITEGTSVTTITGKSTLIYKVTGSGLIDVRLVYGSPGNCSDSISVTYVKAYIKADFSIDNSTICSLPTVVNLKNTSQNANIFSWYLSGKLISTDKNTSYTITKKDLPAETYQQIYNHEINSVKLPIKVVVSNTGVCFDSITSQVTVALPVARFMPDKVSGCVPLKVSFSDSSKALASIDKYKYVIGKDSLVATSKIPVSYTFTKPGVYYVSEVIKSGSCIDTSLNVKIVAGDKLKADFAVVPGEVCNGGNIRLIGNSTGNNYVRLWRFESPNLFDISFNSRPDTTFAIYTDTTGYKDINLTIDYNGCLSDTTKKNILNIKGPAGTFTETTRCDSSLVYHFRSEFKPATSLLWNIDTAKFNNIDSVRYFFPKSGDYITKLTATDIASGCSISKTRVIKARQVKASFTLNDTTFCAGDSVLMDASSSADYIKNCYNEGFLWYFGDNSPPRRTFLTKYDHIYSAKGRDTIKLVVTGDNACRDSIRKVVRIFKPAGSFTVDKTSGCIPAMTLNFKNTSTDSTIVKWTWNFGDQASDTTRKINIAHTYSSTRQRTYYPTLIVYDAYQCSNSSSIPVHLVGINKDFQANDNAICTGQTVKFTTVDTTLTSVFWNFGDGSPSTDDNTHTFTKAGQFNVSITATKSGCTDTLTKVNYMSVEKADANFTASDTVFYCFPDTVKFVHNNTIGSPAVDFLWTFDNHALTTRTSASVKYIFTRSGNFVSKLVVRTLNGCQASKSKTIAINGPYAVISVSPQKLCYNDAVTFKMDSIKNLTTFKWFFGDGTTSTTNPAVHKYTSRGKIAPTIQMTNSNCNAVRVLDTLNISRVQALFDTTDSTLAHCYGVKLNFLNKSKYSDSWSWAIDNVVTSTDYTINNVLFSKAGDYNVRLVAKESGGCTDTLIKKYTTVALPSFTIDGDSIICAGKNSATLSVSTAAGKTIRWSPTTTINNPSAFSVIAKPTTATTYTALVTNASGCSSSKTKRILINQPFDLTRNPKGDTSIYLGQKIQLLIQTSAADVNYSWSPNYNISCTSCNTPWVAPAGTTKYKVETKNGCFDFFAVFNVEVIKDFYLEAPTAFTPNGDAKNDIFIFRNKNIKSFELKIFNRWGKIVFSTNDLNNGWDGTVSGHLQNSDTYKYIVKAETLHGYVFEKSGEFILLK
jgi:gliding motility-associated-like protein